MVSNTKRVREQQNELEQRLLSDDAALVEVNEIELTEVEMHEMLAEIRENAAFGNERRFSTTAARHQFEETLPRCDNASN